MLDLLNMVEKFKPSQQFMIHLEKKLKTFHLKQVLNLPIHPKTLQRISENAKNARSLRSTKSAGELQLRGRIGKLL